MPFRIRMADLLCDIDNRHDYIRQRCTDYIVPADGPADLTLRVSDAYIQAYIQWCASSGASVSEAVAEHACFTLSTSAQLLMHDALCMHATVVEYKGSAYAFTAPSGYGKTTHARMWVKAFAPEARIINGDHPVIRWKDGAFYAYGTPFCGKEGYNVNTSAPLRGICYLTRSDTNRIEPMSPAMALAQLFYDVCLNQDDAAQYLALITRLVEHVPVYQLYCTQDEEAARIACRGMQSHFSE